MTAVARTFHDSLTPSFPLPGRHDGRKQSKCCCGCCGCCGVVVVVVVVVVVLVVFFLQVEVEVEVAVVVVSRRGSGLWCG